MTIKDAESWLHQALSIVLGIPIVFTEAYAPSGSASYAVLTWEEEQTGRSLNTRTQIYRLSIRAPAQAESGQARESLRYYLQILDDAFQPGNLLRDAHPFESLTMARAVFDDQRVEFILSAELSDGN